MLEQWVIDQLNPLKGERLMPLVQEVSAQKQGQTLWASPLPAREHISVPALNLSSVFGI